VSLERSQWAQVRPCRPTQVRQHDRQVQAQGTAGGLNHSRPLEHSKTAQGRAPQRFFRHQGPFGHEEHIYELRRDLNFRNKIVLYSLRLVQILLNYKHGGVKKPETGITKGSSF